MNGIDKITGRILSAAELDRDQLLSNAAFDAKEIAGSLRQLADTEALEIIGRGREQARLRIERSAGSDELELRRMKLETKQKMIDAAFFRAKGLLLQLSDTEYVSFLAKLASQALVTGSEEIILCEIDLTRYESSLLPEIKKRAAARGLPDHISIAQETGDFDGGLIVRNGSIETNCTLDAILHTLRDSIVGDIAAILFH